MCESGGEILSLKADLPYPSLDGIGKDCKSLRIVSPAYAGREGELTATLQYVYQAVYLETVGKKETARVLLDIAVCEMHHIEILGSLITRLGAPPVFTACPPYPVGYYSASYVNYAKSPENMLAIDILGEKNAIRGYENMLCELKLPEVRAVISRIVLDERLHLKTLEKIAEKM